MEKILFLLILLIVIYFLFNSKENFDTWPIDYESVTLSPIAKQIGSYRESLNPYDNGFYAHKGYINPMDASNYANRIATNLQNNYNMSKNPNTSLCSTSSNRLLQRSSRKDY